MKDRKKTRTRRIVLAGIAVLALLSSLLLGLMTAWDRVEAGRENAEPGPAAAAPSGPGPVDQSVRPSTPRAPATEAGRALEALRRTVDLAKKGTFYLVLDPRAGALDLRFRGVTARTWPVNRVELGGRRIAFVGSDPRASLGGTVWTAARLVPARDKERPLLEVDSQGTPQGPEPPLIPPAPEEAVPAPSSYLIRFAEGLTVEIFAAEDHRRTDGPGAGATSGLASFSAGMLESVEQHLRDARDALATGASAPPRLRLILPPEEAGSLYRSLPEGTALVIG